MTLALSGIGKKVEAQGEAIEQMEKTIQQLDKVIQVQGLMLKMLIAVVKEDHDAEFTGTV